MLNAPASDAHGAFPKGDLLRGGLGLGAFLVHDQPLGIHLGFKSKLEESWDEEWLENKVRFSNGRMTVHVTCEHD